MILPRRKLLTGAAALAAFAGLGHNGGPPLNEARAGGVLDIKSNRPPPQSYWRVQNLFCPRSGANLSATELDMFATIGGSTDLCAGSGGTPVASGSFSGSFLPTNAFDDNLSTWWVTNNGGVATGWLGYGFLTNVSVAQMQWTARGDASNFVESPIQLRVDNSPDGSTWTAQWYDWFYDWTFVNQTQLTSPIANRQAWRVRITAATGGPPSASFAEVEFRTVSGGSDVTGSTGFSSSVFSNSFTGNNAFDDNLANIWVSGNGSGAPGQWVGTKLSAAMNIVEVALTCREAANAAQAGSAYAFEYYNPGTNAWVTEWTASAAAWTTTNQVQVFTHP